MSYLNFHAAPKRSGACGANPAPDKRENGESGSRTSGAACQLASLNETFCKATTSLASCEKLDVYIRSILERIRQLTGATAVHVFRYSDDASAPSAIHASVSDKHLDILADLEYEGYRWPFVIDDIYAPTPTNLQNADGYWWVYADDPLLPVNHREELLRHQFESNAYLALRNGISSFGVLILRFPEFHRDEFPAVDVVRGLAHQITFALELRSLVEVEHAAVIANEREKAAKERAELVGDIHDILAQGFAAIGIQVQAVERERQNIPPEIQRHLDVIREMAALNLAETRRIMQALRPTELQGGIATALRRVIESSQRQSPARIIHLIEPNLPILPRNVEDQLLRIAKEAITNSLKHAAAKVIRVSLSASNKGGVCLKIVDDGRGFEATSPSAGFGLPMIMDRASQIEAAVTLVTEPGLGTEIIVAWPLSNESFAPGNGKA